EDAHRELGAPRAHESREAHDLATADVEGDAVDDLALLVDRVVDGPVLDPQDLLTDRGRAGREAVLERPAHHGADDALLRHVTPAHVDRLDRLAVPDDRRGVRDRLDLAELVADDDARDALAFEGPDEVDQVLGVRLVDRRRWLDEDQELEVLREGHGYLYE